MRYVDVAAVVNSIPATVHENLQALKISMIEMDDAKKEITARNGNQHWGPIKPYLENASNRKCWYTESKNPGCLNDVEHYRPKAKVTDKSGNMEHWYWFLAFEPINYRLSCQISNRLNANAILGATGGKGDRFPVMPGSPRASNIGELAAERPVILDPCVQEDTELLEFQPDGRPVLSAQHSGDAVARERVESSKLLLNLDFVTFNEDREALYNKIRSLVERGDRYVENGVAALDDVKADLRALIGPNAEYSKAAECYVRCFRDRGWIDALIPHQDQ